MSRLLCVCAMMAVSLLATSNVFADKHRLSDQHWLSSFGSSLDLGYDTFRGMTDVARPDNSGAKIGGNLGIPLPFEAYDLGVQLGASYGVYDWRGRLNTTTGNAIDDTMNQTFVTAGLFHRANYDCGERVSWGVVYDAMFGGNWGLVGDDDVNLSQWRGQISYSLNCRNDIGLLGVLHDRDDIGGQAGGGDLNHYEAISHLDVFLEHRFNSGARGRVWLGIPEGSALDREGSTIDLIFGATFTMPLNNYWEAYGSFQYGNPSSSGNPFNGFGTDASSEIYSNVAVGVVFYPGGRCNCRNPLLPVANNSSFLVDNGRVAPPPGP